MTVGLHRVVVLRARHEHWEVRLRSGPPRADARVFRSDADALAFLHGVSLEAPAESALRSLVADRWLRPCGMDRTELLRLVARWLADGTAVASLRALRPGDQPMVTASDEVVLREPPPPVPVQPRTWIEVQLLDEDGRAVAGEPYWIRLPDASVRQGHLDDQGLVRIEPLDPGECVVRWPSIDDTSVTLDATLSPATPRATAASTARAAPMAQRTWVEFEVWDDDGNPVAATPFHLVAPDGTVVEGTVNGLGRARVDDLPPGVCRVRFPAIDDEAWLLAEPEARVA